MARGLAYARSGQTEMAVLALDRAIKEHPDQPQAYKVLGQIWLEIAETDADRVALSKALNYLQSVSTSSASSETLALLGRALLLDDDPNGARAALNVATSRFPLDPSAFLHLAWLEENDRNWDVVRQLRHSHRMLTQPNATTGDSHSATRPIG